MNISPEIIPQLMDWGLRNTVASDWAASFTQPVPCCAGGVRGSIVKRITAITGPQHPATIQNVAQGNPRAIAGPTSDCPANPPAMPNICVAPISVAARDAGKLLIAI